MCGDFNMIEHASDKIGIHPGGEHHAWYFMRSKLGFIDPNAYFVPTDFPRHLWYTWSNFQARDAHIICWLDRAMLFDQHFTFIT